MQWLPTLQLFHISSTFTGIAGGLPDNKSGSEKYPLNLMRVMPP
jgi:hypothetical protein